MSDFLNKILTVILIFVLLVLAPLLISYTSTDMVTERLVLNETTQFIDRVTDKSQIIKEDLDDLYLGVNSHGGVYNVKVERYIRVASKDPADTTKVRTLYFLDNDEIDSLYDTASGINVATLNIGDVVKVHIEEVGSSSGKRLMWQLLKIDEGKFQFSLAGTVR